MGTKWRVWGSAGEKCVLLYHRKGNAIQYATLYVHSFPFSCPQKILDSEKFHSRLSTPEELKTTADKLRYYRYQKALLQREVAVYAGINESTYIDYESGKRDYYPIDKLSRIAELLEVDITKLLDEYNRFFYDGQDWKIRKIREGRGLTQYQFGKLYGVSAGAVKLWESGKVKMSKETWEKIAP